MIVMLGWVPEEPKRCFWFTMATTVRARTLPIRVRSDGTKHRLSLECLPKARCLK